MIDPLLNEIKNKAYSLGYDLCGVIEAKTFERHLQGLNQRVDKFPSSASLYEPLFSMAQPLEKAPWGKSIIVLIRHYSKYKIPETLDQQFGRVYLFDGRLTCSQEYQKDHDFESYLNALGLRTLKNAVAARWAAVMAGLGHFGKNNFLYTSRGSWVWIDTFIVDAALESNSESHEVKVNCPEHCSRCVDACPTKALSDSYTMDRGKCIAQLTFFSDTLPSEDLRKKMGTWMYGCDLCQTACPKNRHQWHEEAFFPELETLKSYLSLEALLTMDDQTLAEVVKPKFWYIHEDKFWLWRCNAIRAMANSKEIKYHPFIQSRCQDQDERIREMAQWACKLLGI